MERQESGDWRITLRPKFTTDVFLGRAKIFLKTNKKKVALDCFINNSEHFLEPFPISGTLPSNLHVHCFSYSSQSPSEVGLTFPIYREESEAGKG